jgi:hypothetical protein
VPGQNVRQTLIFIGRTLNIKQKSKNRLMKQHTKWFATALTVASGLAIVNSAQAQPWQTLPPVGTYTTTVISDFASFNLGSLYANWSATGWEAINGGSGIAPVITSGSTPGSYEVAATGYGSGATYPNPVSIDAPGAQYAQLTFTVNNAGFGPDNDTQLGNINPQFDIASGAGFVSFTGGGPGYYSGQTYTFTVPLNAAAAATLGETSPGTVDPTTINDFNLEDAGYSGTGAYDVTYDNFVLLTPVPEPATLALLAIGGAAGLMVARRRVKAS